MLRLVAALAAIAAAARAGPLTDIVDTRIGTGGFGFAIGELNPGAQVPFGSMRLGPDTGLGFGVDFPPFDHYGGYYDSDTHIRAFSHTHFVGAGVGDYGNVGVMATNMTVDEAVANARSYRSRFSHDQEVAQPGYYAATLLDSGVQAEVTATGPFSGVHQYTCDPSSGSCSLVVDVCHCISENITDACRFADLTASPVQDAWNPASAWAAELSGSVLMHGSLSGRSQHGGGVRIYFSLTVSPLATTAQAPSSNVSLSLWSAGHLAKSALSLRPSFNTSSGSAGAVLHTASGSGFVVRAGISFVSVANAQANVAAEQAAVSSFEAAKQQSQAEWEAQLGRLSVGAAAPAVHVPGGTAGKALRGDSAGATASTIAAAAAAASSRAADGGAASHRRVVSAEEDLDWRAGRATARAALASHGKPRGRAARPLGDWQAQQRRELYSGLYRSMLAPSIFSESDGRYASFAGDVRQWGGAAGSRYRTDMSLWDIHRSQSAWLTLVAPSAARDVTNSLVRMTADGGKLPRWPLANVYTGCMIASHGVVVMADAVLRGTGGVDASSVLNVAINTVDSQAAGSTYGSLGWVSSEENQRGSSSTLAFAFDDAVAARLARAAGSPAGDAAAKRSGNWRNVLTIPAGEVGPFACPRNAAGQFSCPSDLTLPYPLETHYVEGDGWNYRWFVPGAPEDLIGAFPSADVFASQLELYMNNSLSWPLGGERSWLPNPWYWAGNEPSLLNPWQFVFAGPQFAAKTQFWTRAMAQLAYGPDGDGLPGNDDFGTMSAWQVLANMGIYPLAGSPTFVLGSPAFQTLTLSLPPAEAALLFGYESAEHACAAGAPALCERDGANVDVLRVQWDSDVSGGAVYASGATVNGVALPQPLVNQSALLGCVCGCGNAPAAACEGRGAPPSAPSLARVLAGGPTVLEFRRVDSPTPWSE
ncbi:hypothetical protein FNF27_01351 [Cafeteria roenbergensis]|uniref:Glycosyl hydrolase family 92 domain-containing protein n=1 Tax=Cafeteria roenbergensis TaxID=33653 RepID=A0A5A8EMN2_CAFRO|nr:hypothetical protein FNF27_01351 [Cafeteria roenbergensis]